MQTNSRNGLNNISQARNSIGTTTNPNREQRSNPTVTNQRGVTTQRITLQTQPNQTNSDFVDNTMNEHNNIYNTSGGTLPRITDQIGTLPRITDQRDLFPQNRRRTDPIYNNFTNISNNNQSITQPKTLIKIV